MKSGAYHIGQDKKVESNISWEALGIICKNK
jgi:hypothetical protein